MVVVLRVEFVLMLVGSIVIVIDSYLESFCWQDALLPIRSAISFVSLILRGTTP